MSLVGRWRIVAMPDSVEDYPDMMEPAYIFFNGNHSMIARLGPRLRGCCSYRSFLWPH
jgi:hypothetical protein